jgi:ABC-type multidrug transport system fused ATPase/permease subunit
MDQLSSPLNLLRNLFRAARWKILLTYALFNLENLLRLSQPYALGWAINDLIQSKYTGLTVLVTQHVSHLLVALFRQMYDTRVFSGLYTSLAAQLVTEQTERGIEISRVAARSSLSREFVEFFERHVPMVVRSVYSCVGAMFLLGLYDGLLIPACLLLVFPVSALNCRYGKKTLALSGSLHDELENEMDVISSGEPERVRLHYDRVARWRVRLSDLEAVNFGLTEFFVLGLIIAALVRLCQLPDIEPGDMFAVFRYLMMFIAGLDSVPTLVLQVSRLRDIGRRLAAA